MNQNIRTLNGRFAIREQLHFRDMDSGFMVAEVENRHCTASIALNGAHLLSWQPTGAAPVIWMSEDAVFENGKPIRGGIPVCWPWFGAHATQAAFPAHGFARTSIWEVFDTAENSDGSTSISLKMETTPDHPLWPFASSCELRIRCGATLEMSLTTTNLGDEPLIIGQALHTYFAVGDIRRTVVTGLDERDYLDKPDAFARKHQRGPIAFEGEVDRIYLKTADDCTIADPALDRTVRINKQGSHSTIVWNPGLHRGATMGDLGENGYLGFVCVESANAAEDQRNISPGESHQLAVSYSLDSDDA